VAKQKLESTFEEDKNCEKPLSFANCITRIFSTWWT
jgi:hypothetical protein